MGHGKAFAHCDFVTAPGNWTQANQGLDTKCTLQSRNRSSCNLQESRTARAGLLKGIFSPPSTNEGQRRRSLTAHDLRIYFKPHSKVSGAGNFSPWHATR